VGILTTRAALQPSHTSVQPHFPLSHTLPPPTGAREGDEAGLAAPAPHAGLDVGSEFEHDHPGAAALVPDPADTLKRLQRVDGHVVGDGVEDAVGDGVEDGVDVRLDAYAAQPRELVAPSSPASLPGCLSRVVWWEG